jgi:uncharacterized protein
MPKNARARLIQSDFQPAWWLRSPHLQTIWPSLLRPGRALDVEWERMELDDGDFIDLAWRRRPGPLVLLIHGLEGSLESHYAAPMLQTLERHGFSAVFMHLRGCGREPNRLTRSYHSGATEDLAEVLEKLDARDERPDALIGISLGGNLLLKYLGETGPSAKTRCAIAISVPFRLEIAAQQMEKGLSRLYGRYLLHALIRSFRQKFHNRNSPLDFPIERIATIQEFDQRVTAPLNGFAGADDYYRRCSCFGFLQDIESATLILHALDDPLMRPEVIPGIEALGSGVTLELSQRGGHVGFLQGDIPGRPGYWLEQRVPAYLRQQLAG